MGAKVGIYAWNRAEWVEAMIGAFKARLVPVNINYRYVSHELLYLFDNADLEALVVEREFAPLVAEVMGAAPRLRHVLVVEDGSRRRGGASVPYEDALEAASPARPAIERSSDDLYLLYTGGTTGMPKGVMWRARGHLLRRHGRRQPGPGADDLTRRGRRAASIPEDGRRVALNLAPLMHGAAQWNLFITLLVGGQITLYTRHTFDPAEAWRIADAGALHHGQPGRRRDGATARR